MYIFGGVHVYDLGAYAYIAGVYVYMIPFEYPDPLP